ncbi:hypothetical protein DSO57_1027240 [Entomophthora muscae]|uniref:Uncharacterized protein n=1 Tax=Entomophthora muscae TaxID=34485 RepID=A0ACC2RSY0_9FUNG|nr:hypothetical protein DSO57_1027240 [Entomophthora muscae]
MAPLGTGFLLTPSVNTELALPCFLMDPSAAAPATPPMDILVERISRVPLKPASKVKRAFDLPPAPVFHPTEQEFKDPAAYIASIYPRAVNSASARLFHHLRSHPSLLLTLKKSSFARASRSLT